jgi:hypothetical protein
MDENGQYPMVKRVSPNDGNRHKAAFQLNFLKVRFRIFASPLGVSTLGNSWAVVTCYLTQQSAPRGYQTDNFAYELSAITRAFTPLC